VLDVSLKQGTSPLSICHFSAPTFLRFLCYYRAEYCLLSMHVSHLSIVAFTASQAVAVTLWATSYGDSGLGYGGVTSLNLDQSATGAYTLTATAFLNGTSSCGDQSSWLTKDSYNDVIYCVDEAWGLANGSITSFKPSANGSLVLFDKETTLASPVATVVYNGGAALVAAH
jgi:hypothetical protein